EQCHRVCTAGVLVVQRAGVAINEAVLDEDLLYSRVHLESSSGRCYSDELLHLPDASPCAGFAEPARRMVLFGAGPAPPPHVQPDLRLAPLPKRKLGAEERDGQLDYRGQLDLSIAGVRNGATRR